MKNFNKMINDANWRLQEVAARTTNLSFVSWPAFCEPYDHLLAKDGLHLSYDGTDVVANKLKRVCRQLSYEAEMSSWPALSSVFTTNTEVKNTIPGMPASYEAGKRKKKPKTITTPPPTKTTTMKKPKTTTTPSTKKRATKKKTKTTKTRPTETEKKQRFRWKTQTRKPNAFGVL